MQSGKRKVGIEKHEYRHCTLSTSRNGVTPCSGGTTRGDLEEACVSEPERLKIQGYSQVFVRTPKGRHVKVISQKGLRRRYEYVRGSELAYDQHTSSTNRSVNALLSQPSMQPYGAYPRRGKDTGRSKPIDMEMCFLTPLRPLPRHAHTLGASECCRSNRFAAGGLDRDLNIKVACTSTRATNQHHANLCNIEHVFSQAEKQRRKTLPLHTVGRQVPGLPMAGLDPHTASTLAQNTWQELFLQKWLADNGLFNGDWMRGDRAARGHSTRRVDIEYSIRTKGVGLTF